MDLPDIPVPPQSVAELRELPQGKNQSFTSILAIRRVAEKTAKNGNRFLAIELGDRTGSFNVVCFQDSDAYSFFEDAALDTIVRFKGTTAYYQDRFSPSIDRVQPISDQELAEQNLLTWVVETPPEDMRELWEEMKRFIADIGHPQLRETVENAMEEVGDRFRIAPAAAAMHHAYQGGLLEHTVHIARAAKALFPLYPEVPVDVAMAGILLHDVGKVLEYEGHTSIKRSRIGAMQGHVVLGYQIARRAALKARLDPENLERLEHIILSHQGELEWGATAHAATPEAVFVSMVDNLDAKMGMVQRALRVTPRREEFSDYLPGLSASVLVNPKFEEESAEGSDETDFQLSPE